MYTQFMNPFDRMGCLFLVFIVGIISGCSSNNTIEKEQHEINPPNIIIIFTDDQGYEDVGVFGAKNIETPNLDLMAKNGVQFTNFHVSNAVCSASRASILTGCYSNRLGIFGALSYRSKHG